MKKLFIFDEYNSSKQNGIGTYLHNLRQCLKDEFKVCMLSFNDDVISFKKEEAGGIVFMRFPIYCNGAFLHNHQPGLAIVRMEIPDDPENIFVVNHFLCNALLLDLRKYYPKSKIVFVVHDQTWTDALKGDFQMLESIIGSDSHNNSIKHGFEAEKKMYQLAHHVVCMNSDTEWLLKNIYQIEPDKVHFIPNGLEHPQASNIDEIPTRKQLYISSKDKVIVYAGRTTACKGIDDLLVAFNDVAKAHPEARLIVLGEVHRHSELTKLCQDSIARVTFAGLVPKDKLMQWYAIADVGVVPSYCEQCGYTGTEFMAMRVPVVASDALGVRCMFKDGETGFVATIGNRSNRREYQANLSTAIIKALESDHRIKEQMLTSAYELYQSRYSIEAMKEGYVRLFTSI